MNGADGDKLTVLENTKNQECKERNYLVRVLASFYPSGIKKTAIEGWDEAWHNCVYIDMPQGQVSWHYHDDEAWLFDTLPPYDGEYDGHTTDEKYKGMLEFAGVECEERFS